MIGTILVYLCEKLQSSHDAPYYDALLHPLRLAHQLIPVLYAR